MPGDRWPADFDPQRGIASTIIFLNSPPHMMNPTTAHSTRLFRSRFPAIRASAIGILVSLSLHAVPKRPEPELLFIENNAMKIGIDRSMGASITWLSWTGHP